MYAIRITEDKKEKLSACAEKILRAAGKMMQCIEEFDHYGDDEYDVKRGHRTMPRGYREPGYDDYDDDEDMVMGERRHRNSRGRYSRY